MSPEPQDPASRRPRQGPGFYPLQQGRKRWELESTLLFMMTSVLRSRTETGFESTPARADEDVNVYLAGILAAYLDPRYTSWATPFISRFDTDVATMVHGSPEREKYWIYKVNADHLMLTLGLFDPPESGLQATARPAAPAAAEGLAGLAAEQRSYVGRGETYYELAASYGRALARRGTASTEVLGKLSRGFEGYVIVLNHMRSHYFNLIERLGRRGMQAVRQIIEDEAQAAEYRQWVDRLLDLYSEWRRSRDPALRTAIECAVERIRAIDPSFRFDVPE